MLTKNKARFIQSLHTKKGRDVSGLFIAEGSKIIDELLSSGIKVTEIYKVQGSNITNTDSPYTEIIEIKEEDLWKISSLVTPNEVLAVVEIPKRKLVAAELKEKLTLVLDNIQDPGNLGTIIRIADWFGIENIICSLNSVDVYNPKVVQATMGSVFRVKVFYDDLVSFLKESKSALKIPVYAATMKGRSVYEDGLSK